MSSHIISGGDREPIIADGAGGDGVDPRQLPDALDTPAEVLVSLSRHSDTEVRWRALRNEYLPSAAANAAVDDPRGTVRETLAGRYDVTPASLRRLAEDPSAKVRRAVAANRRTPPEALEALKSDPVAEVQAAAWANLSTPLGPELPAETRASLTAAGPGETCDDCYSLHPNPDPYQLLFAVAEWRYPDIGGYRVCCAKHLEAPDWAHDQHIVGVWTPQGWMLTPESFVAGDRFDRLRARPETVIRRRHEIHPVYRSRLKTV